MQQTSVVPMKKIEVVDLTMDALMWLEERGISSAVAEAAGIKSGKAFFRKLNREADAVGFVYRHKDNDYAVKWRCIEDKSFTQSGSAQTLYLADRCVVGEPVLITEGEADAISFWQIGMAAVSIPSGAIEANTQDDASRLKWMAHHDELLAKAPDIYLAVDADGPGQTTANELARRLGKAKCWKVTYPQGCKDANDVLVKHGPDALRDCIKNAIRWPIEGVASASDYLDRVVDLYRKGMPPGLSTGFKSVDEFFTLNPGNLVVVTGVPNSGKSPFIDTIMVNAMRLHDWRVAFAAFESPPAMHLARLAALKTGKPFGDGPTPRMNEETLLEAMAWLNERVTLLTHDGVMPTPESLIERFETAVRRMGVKAVVVDPFNFVKLTAKEGGGVDTAAIGEMLAKFKMFAERAEVVFFIIAHPAKPMGQSADWVPGGYAISHSAEWYNRPDFGLTIHRSKEKGNEFHVWKAKWSHQGKVGWCGIQYVPATGGFSDGSEWDLPDEPF